ncbi:MAG: hypothetical protein A2X93_07910 [Deltaproteobacteria bacterium GWC2_56_8]|nr:MAG: hypothetical protein A2X93_07910 [Deltaproteobacteria bacterium GWC2_56_8]
MNYQELLDGCSLLLHDCAKKEKGKIEDNFGIGEMIFNYRARNPKNYGAGLVKKLADELSTKRKKVVYRQRLYECLDVYDKFKTLDAVWTFEKTLNCDLTWSYIVKYCLGSPRGGEDKTDDKKSLDDFDFDKEKIEEHYHRKLTSWETERVEQEMLADNIDLIPDSVREEVVGFFVQTGVLGDSDGTEKKKKNDKKDAKNVVAFPRKMTVGEMALPELLKAAIDCDEVTGELLEERDRKVYFIDGGAMELDNLIVVSTGTMSRIGDYSVDFLSQIANRRNARLATEALLQKNPAKAKKAAF